MYLDRARGARWEIEAACSTDPNLQHPRRGRLAPTSSWRCCVRPPLACSRARACVTPRPSSSRARLAAARSLTCRQRQEAHKLRWHEQRRSIGMKRSTGAGKKGFYCTLREMSARSESAPNAAQIFGIATPPLPLEPSAAKVLILTFGFAGCDCADRRAHRPPPGRLHRHHGLHCQRPWRDGRRQLWLRRWRTGQGVRFHSFAVPMLARRAMSGKLRPHAVHVLRAQLCSRRRASPCPRRSLVADGPPLTSVHR